MKNNKGITLTVLTITIVVLTIITATIIYSKNPIAYADIISSFKNDLLSLDQEVYKYYEQNGRLPIVRDNYDAAIEYTNLDFLEIEDVKNPNDGEQYFVIDLSLLTDETGSPIKYSLGNKGLQRFKNGNSNADDLYIINEDSRTIYYPKGVKYQELTYYRYVEDYNEIELVDINVEANLETNEVGE